MRTLSFASVVALLVGLTLPAMADAPAEPPVAVAAMWTPVGELLNWIPPTDSPAYYNVYGVDASGAATFIQSTAASHVMLNAYYPTYAVTAVSVGGVESAAQQSVYLAAGECLTIDPTTIPPFYYGPGPCEPPGGHMINLSLP